MAEFEGRGMLSAAWLVVGLAIFGILCALLYSRLGIYIGHDPAYIMDLANSIALGRGLVVNNFEFPQFGGQLVPLTTWPPGLPGIASLLILAFNLSSPVAVIVVNLFALALIVGLTVLIGYQSKGGLSAAIAGALIAASPELWVGATRGFSEPLFIAGLLALAFYLGRRTADDFRHVVAAAAICAAAVYIRYAGYFLFLALGLLFVTSRDKSERWYFVKVGIVFSGFLVPLVAHNYFAIGDARGNVRPASDVTFFENLYMAGFGILDSFLPERFVNGLLTWLKGWQLWVAGLIVVTLFVFITIRELLARSSYRPLAAISLAYFLFYVIIRSFITIDLLTEERIWWPVLPFILLFVGRWCAGMLQNKKIWRRAAACFVVGSYLLLSAAYLYTGPYRKDEFYIEEAVRWIEHNLPTGTCLVTEDEKEGFPLRAYLPHYPVVFIPPGSLRASETDVIRYLQGFVLSTGCGHLVSLPRYVNRYDEITSYQGASFLWSRSFQAIFNSDYSGPADVLVATPGLTIVQILSAEPTG